MGPLDNYIKDQLNNQIKLIGDDLERSDVIAIVSPIWPNLDATVRNAIETNPEKNPKLAVILQTQGGVVEVVERIVDVLRNFYDDMAVIVPDQAMSAGTVFALSADRILMNYFSRLGPIDPQIIKDGKLVPALSYLKQYEKLNERAREGNLTTAEYAMLGQLDIGELHQFEQARELSVELLIKWLSTYKFKDWNRTETEKKKVTGQMKQKRAEEIAKLLNDPERWHSHGRGISMDTLRNELQLKIEDFSKHESLADNIKKYFDLLMDYLNRHNIQSFVHTENCF